MPLRSDTSQRYPSLPLLSNTELKVQANVIRQLKEMSIQIGKEDIQLCLFIDDRIVYIEKPKELTTKIEIKAMIVRLKDSRLITKVNCFPLY